MREIKFRAWDKEHNKMWFMGQEGEEVGKCTDFGIWTFQSYFNEENCLEAILIRSFCNGVGYEDEVIKLPIMQYTGLKDKNGKEIYEGDYLKDCEGKIMLVVWERNGFKLRYDFERKYQGEKYMDKTFIELVNTEDKRWGFEVIGNIYENPELLKQGGIYDR